MCQWHLSLPVCRYVNVYDYNHDIGYDTNLQQLFTFVLLKIKLFLIKLIALIFKCKKNYMARFSHWLIWFFFVQLNCHFEYDIHTFAHYIVDVSILKACPNIRFGFNDLNASFLSDNDSLDLWLNLMLVPNGAFNINSFWFCYSFVSKQAASCDHFLHLDYNETMVESANIWWWWDANVIVHSGRKWILVCLYQVYWYR